MPINNGKIRVKIREDEFDQNVYGPRVVPLEGGIEGYSCYDNVPLCDYEVLVGDPFFSDPIMKMTFLQTPDGLNEITFLNHMQLLWLQVEGVEVEGMPNLEELDIKIISVA